MKESFVYESLVLLVLGFRASYSRRRACELVRIRRRFAIRISKGLASQSRSRAELLQAEEGIRRGAEALRRDHRRQSKFREDRRSAVHGRTKQSLAGREQGQAESDSVRQLRRRRETHADV